MKMNTNETPLEDLRKDALKHYEEASKAICHWNSFVENAIKNYIPNTEGVKELKTASKIALSVLAKYNSAESANAWYMLNKALKLFPTEE